MSRRALLLLLGPLGIVLCLTFWFTARSIEAANQQAEARQAAEAEATQAQPQQRQQAAAGQGRRRQNQQGQQKKRTQQGNRQTAPGQMHGSEPGGRKATEPPPAPNAAGVPVLSSGDSYDDFVSVARAPDGTLYAAYAAYFDGHDQIRLHRRLPSGAWSTRTHVPLVRARADIWMPQVAVDASNRLWVIWSEQTELTRTESGNWDLYARSYTDDTWGPIVRLTDDPKPDINPFVTVDARYNIVVVWQGHADNTGDVMLCRFDGQQWSQPLAVTSGSDSDWYPQAAIDSSGVIWIAFDSYRNGDYDVFLTSVRDGQVGEVIPIAQSHYYEAHASVACTPDGRVWVAWEEGGANWGKDQGYWLRASQEGDVPQQAEAHPTGGGAGTTLGSTRSVRVACWHNERLLAAPPLDAGVLPANHAQMSAMPGLCSDVDGRLWLRFRLAYRADQRRPGQYRKYWTEQLTHLGSDGWSKAEVLPGSTGRTSVFSHVAPLAEGGVLVGYSSDQRGPANYHAPVRDIALVTTLERPEQQPGVPELAEYEAPAIAGEPWDGQTEQRQVAAIRKHRVEHAGQTLRVVRGDLHRHTEMSWDVGPGADGSYLDFYRYMIDVASMDFGGLTDHQGGGHYPYHWWLTEKSCDMYYLPPRFVPLYGYERSARFPNGHRNVFHSYRGVPVFPFQLRLDQSGQFPGVGSGELATNDTKLLYEYLHGSDGIAISHTSGTSSMGTDWRDNDPAIEPVVEIYQGARNSYETLGAPRVHDIANQPASAAPGGFTEEGMIWNALAKGYRLGNISSSDHGSTHISYALVYTPANDRESILSAIRQRHTYGSTDNMIVACWAGDHFMGDEFNTSEQIQLRLQATGTSNIERVDLVRNNRYIFTATPRKASIDIDYVDMEPEEGLNYYYFRLLQDDGQLAWASPIWINWGKE